MIPSFFKTEIFAIHTKYSELVTDGLMSSKATYPSSNAKSLACDPLVPYVHDISTMCHSEFKNNNSLSYQLVLYYYMIHKNEITVPYCQGLK